MIYWQGTVLDTDKWQTYTKNGSVSQDNAIYTTVSYSNDEHSGSWIQSKFFYPWDKKRVIKFRVYPPSALDFTSALGCCFDISKPADTREQYYNHIRNGIFVYLRPDAVNPSQIHKVINGTRTALGSTWPRLTADTWHNVEIHIDQDNYLQVFFDGELKQQLLIPSDARAAIGDNYSIGFGVGTYRRTGAAIYSDLDTGGAAAEQSLPLRIAAVTEAFAGLQVPRARGAEAWAAVRVQRAVAAEKTLQIYIDISARLERAAQLHVVGLVGFERLAALAVRGTLEVYEAWAGLSVEARDKQLYEMYQQLLVIGAVGSDVFQIAAALLVDGSEVEYYDLKEITGLYYKQYEVRTYILDVPRRRLLTSLRINAPAQLVLTATLITEGGPVVAVDRVVELIYNGWAEEEETVEQAGGGVEHTALLRLVSPTAGLGWLAGNKGAKRITKDWPRLTMAREVMDDIFEGSGLSYDFRPNDFVIGQLDVQGQWPHEIWPRFLAYLDVYTDDSGVLVIDHKRPVDPVVHDLDPADYKISAVTQDDGGQIRYNSVRVGNYQEAVIGDGTLAPPEEGEEEGGMRAVYGWPVPFRRVWLRGCHLPEDGFELRAEGVVETLELEDTVSFDGGLGRTTRPIHGLQNVDWMNNTNLGALTPSEDGQLVAAEAGRSVAKVRYITKRYKFYYRDNRLHTWLLWLTDTED